MKQILLILSFFFTAPFQGMSQCPQVKDLSLGIAVDVTDQQHLMQFRAWASQEFKVLENYLEQKGIFSACGALSTSIITLNDLGENRLYKVGYGVIDPQLSKTQINQNVIRPFFKTLSGMIYSVFIEKEYTKTEHTRLWEPLSKFLKKSQGNGERLLIVFSDLLEHNEGASLYRQGDLDVEEFERRMIQSTHTDLPKDLSNSKIIFVSYRFLENDRHVSRSQYLWKSVLEKRGATVYTSSSLELELLLR